MRIVFSLLEKGVQISKEKARMKLAIGGINMNACTSIDRNIDDR